MERFHLSAITSLMDANVQIVKKARVSRAYMDGNNQSIWPIRLLGHA
jgi:hypothetical protein